MSKLSNAVKEQKEKNDLRLEETVTNFMGGDSYVINPLDTLKMVSASSIFGEPSYYRDSAPGKSDRGIYKVNPLLADADLILSAEEYDKKSTTEIFETVIDNALSYDYQGTLDWAVELRNKFNMRLNPQVIMVRAANHPNRKEFTTTHPGLFDEYEQKIMKRADEPMTQMAYFMFKNNGRKNNMPSILKRSWANNLNKLDKYKVAKYKNHEIGMINAVRLCHANSEPLSELMRTGTVEVPEEDKTWENLRSEKKSWKEIYETVDMGHMALLRNLRGVFTEVDDLEFCKKYLDKLKSGVKTGKQFPFRYYSAYKMIEQVDVHHKPVILDALEECIDLAIDNFPKLKGKTMCLSDNSRSAWGAFTSEYGTNTVAEIDNLSSVITGMCSDEGYVGKFGDRLSTFPVKKRAGALTQAKEISSRGSHDVGGATEGGIWEFFQTAIDNKKHFDNIFIYSDMQAGHGGLYGTSDQAAAYTNKGYACTGRYINVYKLIEDYRKYVNPKVNVFCIQTAGYNNVLVPELAYRTAILYGWTGKEAEFAKTYIDLWDEVERKKQ